MNITTLSLFKSALICFACLFNSVNLEAQAPQEHTPVYPRIGCYVGINHPLFTFDSDGTHKNFSSSYTVGMPTGINIWKTAKVGLSFEVVPFIRAEKGISK